MYEYKVLSQQDHLSGILEAKKLEETLNIYAKEGWRVISMTTGQIVSPGAVRDEFVIVMERKVVE